MNIINISYDGCGVITICVNLLVVILLIALLFAIVCISRKIKKNLTSSSLKIDEIKLGVGDSQVTLVYDTRDKEIAYKLWVELTTRKIGIPFDEENDVINEVYNSWYEFFRIARELMKDIPVNSGKNSIRLAELTAKVLNEGLRPHLTLWQARYRKWYDKASKEDDRDPQLIQKDFDRYDELIKDIKITNSRMIEYGDVLLKISKG